MPFLAINAVIRLSGNTFVRPSEGRVEVFYNGEWGTVCDVGWDLNDARVVCQQLGYPDAIQAIFNQSAFFGQGSGSVLMTNISCNGTERHLFDCAFEIPEVEECTHAMDAGVICEGQNVRGIHIYQILHGICGSTVMISNYMHNAADIGTPSVIPEIVANDTVVAISALLSFIFLVTISLAICLTSFGCWKRYTR